MEQTLMSLVGDYTEIMEMVNDPEVDQQTVLDTLEGINGEIEVKADGYAMVLRGIEFERAALNGKREYLKRLMDEIDKQDKRLADNETAMKDRLMAAMIATGKDETGIKTDQFEFTVKSAGGVAKLEVDEDVPEEFIKTEIVKKPDNSKIRDYLKDHQVEWARLLPRKRSLEIKGV